LLTTDSNEVMKFVYGKRYSCTVCKQRLMRHVTARSAYRPNSADAVLLCSKELNELRRLYPVADPGFSNGGRGARVKSKSTKRPYVPEHPCIPVHSGAYNVTDLGTFRYMLAHILALIPVYVPVHIPVHLPAHKRVHTSTYTGTDSGTCAGKASVQIPVPASVPLRKVYLFCITLCNEHTGTKPVSVPVWWNAVTRSHQSCYQPI
jgi:hypothetical protein